MGVSYFCNIDPDGQNDNRIDLMRPTAAEQRDYLRAEMWIGFQLDDPAIIQGDRGLKLVQINADGEKKTTELGDNQESFMDEATIASMASVSQEIRMRIDQLGDDALQSLKTRVKTHDKENEEKYGLDSEEFDNWQILREKIRELLN